jgi:hypothetical protein
VGLYIMSQKDVLSLDVLSLRTFCPAGRFVPTDFSSLRTFCPYGCFVPWMLGLRVFCLRMFCLWMFCPYGCFVSRRFVWAPLSGSKGVSLWFYFDGGLGCCPGGKQRPVKPTFSPFSLFNSSLWRKRSKCKGTVVQDRSRDLFKVFAPV